MEIRTVAADQPPASDLIEAMILELVPLYGRIDGPDAPKASPKELTTFIVLHEDGEPVAGGGLKRLEPGVVEIKRMYVVPAARGRGVARTLLAALEDEARRQGFEIARLDTGPQQPHAQALYESAGYAEIGNFNANPHASFWGEKRL